MRKVEEGREGREPAQRNSRFHHSRAAAAAAIKSSANQPVEKRVLNLRWAADTALRSPPRERHSEFWELLIYRHFVNVAFVVDELGESRTYRVYIYI